MTKKERDKYHEERIELGFPPRACRGIKIKPCLLEKSREYAIDVIKNPGENSHLYARNAFHMLRV
jgi:hypothetical protein